MPVADTLALNSKVPNKVAKLSIGEIGGISTNKSITSQDQKMHNESADDIMKMDTNEMSSDSAQSRVSTPRGISCDSLATKTNSHNATTVITATAANTIVNSSRNAKDHGVNKISSHSSSSHLKTSLTHSNQYEPNSKNHTNGCNSQKDVSTNQQRYHQSDINKSNLVLFIVKSKLVFFCIINFI